MKLLLSLATTLLLSTGALAMDSKAINVDLSPGAVSAQMDKYYSYNFGSTSVHFARYADFNVNNNGPGNLYIRDIVMSGVDFQATYNCPSVLPPNTFCTLRVRFAPWNEGFKAGRLYVLTDSDRLIIDLSGWATR